MFSTGFSNRDRAVLLAVANGRVTSSAVPGATTLNVDGVPVADQFAVGGLLRFALIAIPPRGTSVQVSLTERGRVALSGCG